jgi:hypothetical protein
VERLGDPRLQPGHPRHPDQMRASPPLDQSNNPNARSGRAR